MIASQPRQHQSQRMGFLSSIASRFTSDERSYQSKLSQTMTSTEDELSTSHLDTYDDDGDEEEENQTILEDFFELDPYNEHRLLRNFEEAQIRELAKSHPKKFRTIFNGKTALAQLCSLGASDLETFQAVHEAFPEAHQVTCGVGGRLPLHIACHFGRLSSNVVAFLIEKNPQALWRMNVFGEFPLEVACSRPQSHKYIPTLVAAYPMAALRQDTCGRTPLLNMLWFPPTAPTVIAIQCMIQACPALATTRHTVYGPPLKTALQRNYVSIAIIRSLLDANPEAVDEEALALSWLYSHSTFTRVLVAETFLRQQNRGGRAASVLPKSSYVQAHPLHAIFCCPLPEVAYNEAIKIFSNEMIATQDDEGRLPIHLAAEEAAVNKKENRLPAIRKIIEIHPPSALVRDPRTGMYPFMLVASSTIAVVPRRFDVHRCCGHDRTSSSLPEERTDLIYDLFRRDPIRFLKNCM